MIWNWQQPDWPKFRWNSQALEQFEAQFLHQSGILIGISQHFSRDDHTYLVIEMTTNEALKTSEIEGEILNRESVQSSIRRHFGLKTDYRRISPAENGIADLMMDLHRNFNKPLTHAMLHQWHSMLVNGRGDLKAGHYRTHTDPMQVVSGAIYDPKIHFEAPPSEAVKKEMKQFLEWYEKATMPALTRAGLAHLYFVSIHPFEDGNGRIARAIAEKSLSENLGQPVLIPLSQTIQKHRKAYYQALEDNNRDLEVTDWLVYFAQTILEAQVYGQKMMEFLIQKTKLYDCNHNRMNLRQRKVVERMFREGIEGFKDGLSAENYISITGVSRATATRDLHDLVAMGVFLKTGELKSTRYYLNLQNDSEGASISRVISKLKSLKGAIRKDFPQTTSVALARRAFSKK